MQWERVRVWQWCVIGAAVGCAVAAVKVWAGPAEPEGVSYAAPSVFEQHVLARRDPSRAMVGHVDRVVLHPPQDDIPVTGERTAVADFVSYTAYLATDKKDDQGKPLFRVAPYRLLMHLQQPQHKSVLGDVSKLSLREYLLKLRDYTNKLDKAKYPLTIPFDYRFAWYESTEGTVVLYALGGLVLFGGAWPVVLSLLVGAGFGRVSKEQFSLWRYRAGKAGAAKPKRVTTDEEWDRIRQLEEELERKLKEGAEPRRKGAATVAAATPAPVKPLNAAAADAPKAEASAPEKPKGYGADRDDYYPTEVHGKHDA